MAKCNAKRARAGDAATARPRTISAVVESPYPGNPPDRVERVVDTVLSLYRSASITEAQYRAARRYRDLWDAVHGSTRCALAFETAQRGLPMSRTPPRATLLAASEFKRASAALNASGTQVVVEMIVGQGYSIEAAARSIFGEGQDGKATQASRKAVGVWLRLGLTVLARGGW